MKIIFATNNQNKVKEIKKSTGHRLEILTLKQAGIDIDIPEPYDTLVENAETKAKTIFKLTREDCFSEDTGLEVTALDGAPGVHTARYAGEEKDDAKNIALLLQNLAGKEDRSAQFHTIIYLIYEGRHHTFEGICKGHIAQATQGEDGFGYDPIFIPEGSDRTFAQMTMEEKNSYSHRKKAMEKLIAFLLK
ncbi:RdgB/HAM1 family non-canonical purine NTP pyrophosphatase [Rhizosphaericola mali]|uniref:dITP/XTP pyrophosphatase n=1 Tax=Rhizosphaericola mali TaxID=2545455 RepID=A0A5P2GAT3_9BACT|nr:RdgB/HAM1 family non-canonical purine NTP pyrophosphatase [Rhizosphaericola mali]QES90800.1 RdgB/HAM1 family non-canonical purine NTP pyrophosphatase [Rhizosphaericola mali]